MTAAGGFIQTVIYGYGGVRYNNNNLTLYPTLPLNMSSRMALHALSYRGAELRADWTASTTTLECLDGCSNANLCASVMVRGGVASGLDDGEGGRGGKQPQKLLKDVLAVFPASTKVVVAVCTEARLDNVK
jgi:hypothetical protein